MRRRAFVGLCGAGLVGLLRAPTLAWAADDTVKMAMTDSLFPGVSGKLLEVAARPFKTLLEKALGRRGRLVPGGGACTLARKLAGGMSEKQLEDFARKPKPKKRSRG